MSASCSHKWCACDCLVYGDDDPNRCPEAFDDERGVARCWLGRGHHDGHQMMFSVWRPALAPSTPTETEETNQ